MLLACKNDMRLLSHNHRSRPRSRAHRCPVIPALAVIILISAALLLPRAAVAGSWNVELSLKRDTIEDAMLMPSALFVDREREQYYVVDSGKNRLLSFSRQGDLLHVFNAGGSLKLPFDMVRTDDGKIWVVEKGRNSLTMIDLKAKKTIPNILESDGRAVYPHRLETDGTDLYVLDKASGTLLVYNGDLVEQQRIVCEKCTFGFFDFKLVGKSVWALDRLARKVFVYAGNGTLQQTHDLGDDVTYPVSIAVGPSGYLYVLDRHSRDVAVYDEKGAYKYRFLQFGIASGQLYYPAEIRFDPWDGLCVVDEGNARVEVYRR